MVVEKEGLNDWIKKVFEEKEVLEVKFCEL